MARLLASLLLCIGAAGFALLSVSAGVWGFLQPAPPFMAVSVLAALAALCCFWGIRRLRVPAR